MKSSLLFVFLLFNASVRFNERDSVKKYVIHITAFNYSMAYNVSYHIDDDSATVKFVGELVNEGDSVLMKKCFKKSERKQFYNFLISHNMFALKNEYINPSVQDGEIETILLTVNGKTKKIRVSNFYQKDIGELFSLVNQLVSPELKIFYETPASEKTPVTKK